MVMRGPRRKEAAFGLGNRGRTYVLHLVAKFLETYPPQVAQGAEDCGHPACRAQPSCAVEG